MEIKITFKRDEEELYNFLQKSGKSKFIKELIKNHMLKEEFTIVKNDIESNINDMVLLEEVSLKLDIILSKLGDENILEVESIIEGKDKEIIENKNLTINSGFEIDDLI